MTVMKAMAETGNPASASDAGVGALCARSAVMGAFLNVKINMPGVEDQAFVESVLAEGEDLVARAEMEETEILTQVEQVMRAEAEAG